MADPIKTLETVMENIVNDPRVRADGLLNQIKADFAKQWAVDSVKKSGYVEVSNADNVEVGQLVRSKWSGSGAVWKVVKVGDIYGSNRRGKMLTVASLTSNRVDTRGSNDMVVVVLND